MMMMVLATAAVARAEPKKPLWPRPAGPIAGKWKATCPGADGMVVEIALNGERGATGHIAELGAASKYGYAAGEEILRLSADDYGDWVGQLEWRSVAGVVRWDAIRFVATPEQLDATMTTSECYRRMPRVK
jgi:hypothetical protein